MGGTQTLGDPQVRKKLQARFIDQGESRDLKYGVYRMLEESQPSQPGGNLIKVVAKVLETNQEEFSSIYQILTRREQLRSPYLCKMIGFYDDSPDVLCAQLKRVKILYEYSNYDLETDIVNRSKFPMNNPDRVDSDLPSSSFWREKYGSCWRVF
jgi:hypothetical protein